MFLWEGEVKEIKKSLRGDCRKMDFYGGKLFSPETKLMEEVENRKSPWRSQTRLHPGVHHVGAWILPKSDFKKVLRYFNCVEAVYIYVVRIKYVYVPFMVIKTSLLYKVGYIIK